MKKHVLIKVFLFGAIALSFVLAQFYFDIASWITPEKVKGWLTLAGGLAPLFYMAIMALVVITPLPSLPLDIAAGAVFGPVPGTIYSAAGATLGALFSFSLARFLGREFLERYLKGHINFCTPCSDKLLTIAVFLFRLIPAFSFDLISYGAGLAKMSVRNYTMATFLGMIPVTFALNYFGSSHWMFFSGKWLNIILGVIAVVLFFALPRWIEKNNLLSLNKLFEHKHHHDPQDISKTMDK